MSKVISINAHRRRFPAGRAAIHRIHGWCEVISVDGAARTIRWLEHIPQEISPHIDHMEVDTGVLGSEVIEEEVIVTREEVVSADELRAV